MQDKGLDWEDIKGSASERSHHGLKVAFAGTLRSAPMSRPEEIKVFRSVGMR